jgi:polyisoprenoid-binding protein YceI
MKKILTILGLLLFSVSISAQDIVTFNVNDEARRDIVTFTSKAPLETIVGKTGEITGFIEVDPNDITGSSKAMFEVDLASLKTGIGMRDKDMRNKFLEVDKYPKAKFDLSSVVRADGNKLEDGKPLEIQFEGDFTVHGVTKPMIINMTVTYMSESEKTKQRLPGDLLHIIGTFDVLLSDHDIERPKFIILKLDDKQVINLDFFASTRTTPPVRVTSE